MSQPGGNDPWQMRASDADRDKYLSVLRECYAEGRLTSEEYEERMQSALAAKTYADLLPVLQALPVRPGSVPGPPGWGGPAPTFGAGRASVPNYPPPVASGQVPSRVVAVPPASSVAHPLGTPITTDTVVLSVFSSNRRDGRWYVPAEQQAIAVMGEVQLDLTSAVLSGEVTEVRAFALMGSVIVTVPDSVQVEVNGSGLLGEFGRKDKRRKPDRGRVPSPGAPVVRVSGFALMGSVEVRTVRPSDKLPPLSVVQPQLPPPPPRPMVEGGGAAKEGGTDNPSPSPATGEATAGGDSDVGHDTGGASSAT